MKSLIYFLFAVGGCSMPTTEHKFKAFDIIYPDYAVNDTFIVAYPKELNMALEFAATDAEIAGAVERYCVRLSICQVMDKIDHTRKLPNEAQYLSSFYAGGRMYDTFAMDTVYLIAIDNIVIDVAADTRQLLNVIEVITSETYFGND